MTFGANATTGNIEGVDSSPLYWPEGWRRTLSHERTNSRYEVSLGQGRDQLLESLRKMNVPQQRIVISTNIMVRRDGLLYANMPEPKDPGVAVYWSDAKWDPQKKHYHFVPRVMACDCWRTVRENVRAIGLSIDALRQLERAGASEILERAFQGFAQLPPSTRVDWRRTLGIEVPTPTRAMIESRYRDLVHQHHPDKGGAHKEMVALNLARDAALAEIGEATFAL